MPRLELTSFDVHLWRVRLEQPEEVHRAFDPTLDDEERARASRFRMPHLQRNAWISRGVTRQILAAYLGEAAGSLRFATNAHGKPSLVGSHGRLRFNLSHSGGWALIGVTLDAEIGVDVEAISPERRTVELAARYFSPAEQRELLSLPEESRLLGFYCGWTRKEAYIKARGRGLSLPLDSFDVTLDPTREARLCRADDDPDFARWRLKALPAPEGFVAAAIVEGDKRLWLSGEWCPAAGDALGEIESLA